MSRFIKRTTYIPGLLLIEPAVHEDERGYFMEYYTENAFFDLGIQQKFVQDNHSKSKKGVLRGLHFQRRHAQGKLVKVLDGSIFDVAVDLRNGSPYYKKWFGTILSEKNHIMLYIPEGFAHGFLVLSETVDFIYKCTDYYYPEYDCGIRWDDPEIGVEWPFSENDIQSPILSNKDSHLKRLSEIGNPFFE
jgi:dTDP-4-dehydrorhamnose 3,5-epimerase